MSTSLTMTDSVKGKIESKKKIKQKNDSLPYGAPGKKETVIHRVFREHGLAFAFFTPFLVLFLMFTIIPVFTAIYLSFTNYTILQEPIWVGLNNYKYLFTSDNTFLIALKNTLAFAIWSGPIGYIASFFMAWIINALKLKSIFALAFYAPSITSGIAMSVIWLYFFSPDSYGLFNNLLMQMGAITKPILWTQEPRYILPIVTIVQVWMSMGNGFLGFLAGFQGLDPEIFEAGSIDGVRNKFQELIYLILPMMKPMLLYGAITAIVGALSIYDVVITIAGFPGPQNAGLTLVGHLNDYAFNRFDMGYASTIAVILFLITYILGQVAFKVFGSKDE